ncbi:MAG: hypothetical protein MJA27_06660 [Pseudanabaenales cyanobacterium]|nr:hypothetical protein [Pseudanabaenales cyanobacterium]
MKPISQQRFNALCYVREPLVRGLKPETEDFTINKEIEWYIDERNVLIATIFLDKIDEDFNFVILGRDANKVYRCIDTGVSFESIEDARKVLEEKIDKYSEEGQEEYPQGDENGAPHYIYKQIVEPEKLHTHFRYLVEEPRFEAARNLIEEIIYTFTDPDGNFIKDFQTGGFDNRLWEIFLYVYLHESGFSIDRSFNAPDYVVERFDEVVCIEAVTVNPSRHRKDMPEPQNQEEINERLGDYMPIKFGSPLYSKLNKKYWEKEHVSGKPLVFAIHDYHQTGSMVWSRTALSEYLYAKRIRLKTEDNGAKSVVKEDIDFHEYEGKKIPSGFFKLPETENISAVLFTNSATITKFNRMGKIAGLGSQNIKMIRAGNLFNPDPEAFDPIPFFVDIDDPSYRETWSESIVMFHNPYTLYPIDLALFPDITHIKIDGDNYYSVTRPYDVMSSRTIIITPTDKFEDVDFR